MMSGGNEKDPAIRTRGWFSHLPPELVVMVASHLDVSSYLALASTSTNLSETLVSQLQWDELLKRTRLDLNLWMALLRRGDLFGPKFGQGSNRRYMKMVWMHGDELDEEGGDYDREDEDNHRAFVMLPWEQVNEWALPILLPWEGEPEQVSEWEQVRESEEEQDSDWEEEQEDKFRKVFYQECEEEEKLDMVRTTEMLEMHKELNQLIGLLKLVDDPEKKLLLSLLHTICQRFPIINGLCPREGRQYKKIEVFLSCPHCGAVHGVTLFGFFLLQQVEAGVRGTNVVPLQKLKVINAANGGDIEDHLESFAAHILRQNQPVESLVETNWSNSCEKRLKLLEHCAIWKLECLYFEDHDNDHEQDETTELWEKLWKGWARLAAKGTIVELMTCAKILKHGNIADLKKVWEITTEKWKVECSERCSREIELGVDLEWSKILALLKKIKTGTYSHDSIKVYNGSKWGTSQTRCELMMDLKQLLDGAATVSSEAPPEPFDRPCPGDLCGRSRDPTRDRRARYWETKCDMCRRHLCSYSNIVKRCSLDCGFHHCHKSLPGDNVVWSFTDKDSEESHCPNCPCPPLLA